MRLLSIRNFFSSAMFIRASAGLALIILTCGFGHHNSGDQGAYITIQPVRGSDNCDFCPGGSTSPKVTIKVSVDGGKDWTMTGFNNYQLAGNLGNLDAATYTFLVPKTGNCLISIAFTSTCDGKPVVCTSNPNPFPVTWPWYGGQIHNIPIYCTGC